MDTEMETGDSDGDTMALRESLSQLSNASSPAESVVSTSSNPGRGHSGGRHRDKGKRGKKKVRMEREIMAKRQANIARPTVATKMEKAKAKTKARKARKRSIKAKTTRESPTLLLYRHLAT